MAVVLKFIEFTIDLSNVIVVDLQKLAPCKYVEKL